MFLLNGSGGIVRAYRVGQASTMALMNNQDAQAAALKAFGRGFNATQAAGRGFYVASVGKFASKYGGKAALALQIAGGAIRTIKGIRDGNGKMVAKGIFGTAAAIGGGFGGGYYGASVGTMICPGVGTFIGGVAGGIIGSVAAQHLVEEVIIEKL
eukprot:403338128